MIVKWKERIELTDEVLIKPRVVLLLLFPVVLIELMQNNAWILASKLIRRLTQIDRQVRELLPETQQIAGETEWNA